LDARRLQKVSLFPTPDLRSSQLHCALFAVQGATANVVTLVLHEECLR
jgi:hypothetical protein